MNVTADTVQPMGPQLVIHGLLTIDTLNEKYVIWSPDTSDIRRMPKPTHRSASEHATGQGTEVRSEVVYYIGGNHKNDFKLCTKIPNLKTSAKILN